MHMTGAFPDKSVMAELTAKMLLETGSVLLNADKPFIFTSGRASPVYTDCRKLISFPRVRQSLMRMGASLVMRDAGFECFDAVAGGETAGIPYGAWMADQLMLPMLYVRKQAKGFGRNAQIEGDVVDGHRVLLVEDMNTDGGSKVNFANAMRKAGLTVEHVFVVFNYGIFPETESVFADAGLTLHYLADFHDVLAAARAGGQFTEKTLAEVAAFMKDPSGWSAAHGGTEGKASA
jgi:orotate phosphoribosyltransferase